MPESEDGTTHDGFSEDEYDFDAYVTQNVNVSLKIFTKLNFIFLLVCTTKAESDRVNFGTRNPTE